MPDHIGKVRAKGLDTTGFSEELIERLWKKANAGKPGDYVLALVELQAVESHGPTIEGKRRLDLVMTLVEPALDKDTEEALRELMRAMVSQRRTDNGELPLDGTTPDLASARSGALSRVERDNDGNPVGVWDGDTDAERDKGKSDDACPFPGCKLKGGHSGDHDTLSNVAPIKKAAAKKAPAKKATPSK